VPLKRWVALNRAARLHATLAVVWVLMIIPTVVWWSESILWVGTISIYALVVGHWSAYEAARDTTEAARDTQD
jgi:hypothetical protein